MDIASLIACGLVNLAMVIFYLGGRGNFNQFPFWAGLIHMGFFFSQAVGGYHNINMFPDGSYAAALWFATLCSIALWIGFLQGRGKQPNSTSWIAAPFSTEKLFYAGAFLCSVGIFFQWKLWSLPEEMLAASQWSGATIKYNFFASLFKIGFVVLWLLYLFERKRVNMRLLVFLIPCFFMLFSAAFLRGRRAEMMNLCSYLLVSLWLVRSITLPKWIMITGLAGGLILVNGVGIYRNIMMDKEVSLSERVSKAAQADYLSSSKNAVNDSSPEFKNYVYFRHIHAKYHYFDFGLWHWNTLVHNYVPSQLVGAGVKNSLKYQPAWRDQVGPTAKAELGHNRATGSTSTGYLDAFQSFGWLGFVKFWLVGWMMGVLYRYGAQGYFMGQLLYVFMLNPAMHAVTHHTNLILVANWVYFFVLAYPLLYWARIKQSETNEVDEQAIVENWGPGYGNP